MLSMGIRLHSVFLACFAAHIASTAEPSAPAFRPVITRIYDDAETATWQVPLALAKVRPSFLTSSYFYARKVRPIYRTYPVYHPDREPAGYLEKLKNLDPEVLWDDTGKRPKLETEADWLRAGEPVYDAPVSPQPLSDALHFEKAHAVVLERNFDCARCHRESPP